MRFESYMVWPSYRGFPGGYPSADLPFRIYWTVRSPLFRFTVLYWSPDL